MTSFAKHLARYPCRLLSGAAFLAGVFVLVMLLIGIVAVVLMLPVAIVNIAVGDAATAATVINVGAASAIIVALIAAAWGLGEEVCPIWRSWRR